MWLFLELMLNSVVLFFTVIVRDSHGEGWVSAFTVTASTTGSVL